MLNRILLIISVAVMLLSNACTPANRATETTVPNAYVDRPGPGNPPGAENPISPVGRGDGYSCTD